jgi:hypothetical protein
VIPKAALPAGLEPERISVEPDLPDAVDIRPDDGVAERFFPQPEETAPVEFAADDPPRPAPRRKKRRRWSPNLGEPVN